MKVLIKLICLYVMAFIILVVSGCASVPALTQDLGDPSPNVRMNAANALYDIQGEDCSKLVVPLLNDSNADVRAKAAIVLQKTGETGVKEIIASADKYQSIIYYESAAAVFSSLGPEGMTWILKEYGANGYQITNIMKKMDSIPYKNILEAVKDKNINDPLKVSAATIIVWSGKNGYEAISAAYDAAEPSEKQGIFEFMLIMCETYNYDLRSMVEGDFFRMNDFQPRLLEAFVNADALGKKKIAEVVDGFDRRVIQGLAQSYDVQDERSKEAIVGIFSQIGFPAVEFLMNTGSTIGFSRSTEIIKSMDRQVVVKSLSELLRIGTIIKSLAEYYDSQDGRTRETIAELLSEVGSPAIKTLISSSSAISDTQRFEIIKSMDRQVVVISLLGLLNSEEDFGKAADCVMKLGYPEFTDWLINYPMEKATYSNFDILGKMLISFASDPRIDARIKSFCAKDDYYQNVMFDAIPMENYKAGLKYKAGKGDGKQDKIIILYYDYGEFDDVEKACYELYASWDSLTLIPADKQISFGDPGNADTAIYIKTKLVRLGTYNFKTLHEKVKGYRSDYVITIVDLRTKKVLGSKTLKGHKLPRTIYDDDVLWSVKRYLGSPPSSKTVDAAIAALLKKYKA